MNKKLKLLLIVLGVAALVVVVISFFIPTKTQQEPSPSPFEPGATYRGLTPGVSTSEDVSKVLGTPVETSQQGNETVNSYKSTSPARDHTADFLDNRLSFFKEIVSTYDKSVDVKSFEKKYGDPPYTLYGEASYGGFNLYAYPEKGVAYIGNRDGNVITEIWYFPPTTFDNFKKTWAPNYSETFSPNKLF
jgi:hypothetical protein